MAAQRVKALYEFWGESEAELSFSVGAIITVIKKDDPGWWEGQLDGRKGLFPSNYVEPYNGPATPASPSRAAPPPRSPTGGKSSPAAANRATSPPAKNATAAKTPPPASPRRSVPAASPSSSAVKSSPSASGTGSTTIDVASERKPAARIQGGNAPAEQKKKPRESRTKFGVWSTNMAYYSGLVMIPLGGINVLWSQVDPDNHDGFQSLISGVYCALLGLAIIYYESMFGTSRSSNRFPLRGIVYLAMSIYMFWTIGTALAGLFLLFVSILNFVSAIVARETYDTPLPKSAPSTAATTDLFPSESFSAGVVAWWTMLRQQNKIGTLIFMIFYALVNALIFGYNVQWWTNKNASLNPPNRISDFGPWAKGFGGMLDLNCAIIVLPVSRTLLRILYNRSTADQGCFSRTLRSILYFIPLDQSITFHKIIAKVILFAAAGHMTFHFLNLTFSYDATIALFGQSPWITGGIIIFLMMIIYTATPDNTRRGQFEIFWYSHHCFVLFFIFILCHGHGGINPHYWMYAIPCMFIYVIERGLRLYRASLPVSILSVSIMEDVLAIEFAKEGVFEEGYKEGQYLFLCSPPISRIQWHPFTISSAPEESSVTVHIRVMGEGSWTRGLLEYFSTIGGMAGKSFIQFDRIGPAGSKVPGKIVGPDGRSILQVDGPHSAPTQHITEYSTCMIIGAGIGATPLSSCMKSVVFHKWRVGIGKCYPEHAHFYWVCAWRDIDAFRWLIRTIKESCDEVTHMRANNSAAMSTKSFSVNIFLTSKPKGVKPLQVLAIDDEVGFWGPPREDTRVNKVRANWTEVDLYKTLKCPPDSHTQLGDVHIWEGRPKWSDHFNVISRAHPSVPVAVTFCGNPFISRDLKKQCFLTNKTRTEDALFKLHKENF